MSPVLFSKMRPNPVKGFLINRTVPDFPSDFPSISLGSYLFLQSAISGAGLAGILICLAGIVLLRWEPIRAN